MEAFLKRLEPVWRPHPGQRTFLLNAAKTKVLACGRRWGKTDVCAVQVLRRLLGPTPSRHLLLAPTLEQAKILFHRLLDLLDRLSAHEGWTLSAKPRASPFPLLRWDGHEVVARSGFAERSLRGQGADDIVVDEAAYVPESLIAEVAMPMMATSNGEMTLISTPRGRNHFWRFFEFGLAGRHGVWSFTAPSESSPYVSADFLAVQRELISPRAYEVEYEAKFTDLEGAIFTEDVVNGCLVPALPAGISGPYTIGIDWGRHHDATSVAVVAGTRKQCWLVHQLSIVGEVMGRQIERIAELLRRYRARRITCDETGLGSIALDMLRETPEGAGTIGVTFNRGSKVDLVNVLSSLMHRRRFQMLPDPDLMREFAHFVGTSRGALGAEPGYHDDRVISLALAVYGLPAESGHTVQGFARSSFID